MGRTAIVAPTPTLVGGDSALRVASDVIACALVSGGAPPNHFRAHARRLVSLRARIARSASGASVEVAVRDLSLSGAGITLPAAAPPGDLLTVSFLAPNLWDPLAISARLVWVRLAGQAEGVAAGLAFEPKDPASVFAFFELLSNLP